MLELSMFVDESGEMGAESKYYLVTVVFHEQAQSLGRQLELYGSALQERGLPKIPFHASPLLNGHREYETLDVQVRKQLLSTFFVMVQHLPITYKTFAYRKKDYSDKDELIARIRRDLTVYLFDKLHYLQQFDRVKIYYDDGQSAVTQALHHAVEYVLSPEALTYKDAAPQVYHLLQVADCLCALELIALKYEAGEQSQTERRFFGEKQAFKKNYLNKIRRMVL